MKNFLTLLLLFVSTLGFSSINCIPMDFIGSSADAIKITLPTTQDCETPTAKIEQREFGTNIWTPANFFVDILSNTAKIQNLDPCTDYQFRVTLLCNGKPVGGCINGKPWSTQCEDCGDCFFSEILLIDQSACKAEFFADFTGEDCEGGINIVGFKWDFGYPNNGGGTGISINHVFPANGTYTVTVETTFKFLNTGEECTVTRSLDVEITDCVDCGDCFFSEILLLDQSECKAEFFADFTGQNCEGGINIVGFEWDFGYANNGGATGIQVSHVFPANGTYTVTVETTFKFLATGEECTVTRTFDVVITDCADCGDCFFSEILLINQSECTAEFFADFTGQDCEGGINIVGFEWDFGYPNNGGATGISVNHVFPANGTYTVTVATTFKFLATGLECTVTRTLDVVITDCEDCGDCFFSEILLLGQDECKAEFFADFTGQKCEGGINIVGFEWDFGYPNNGGASGIQVSHVFPANGTYTVTVETTFKFLASGEECTVTRTFDVVITDCIDCGDCFFSEILLLDQEECKAEFFADYTGQDCEGGINIVGFEWDFGYPNNGGATGIQVSHVFPENGTYTVTVATTFKFLATGEECTVTRTFAVEITDCEDCGDCFFSEILLLDQNECKAEFFADFTGQKCEGGINIVGFEWDFGYPNNGGASGIQVSHEFPENGTYTVTVETTFKFLATGEECTVTRTFDIEITDCQDCGDCFFSEILLLDQDECKAEFFADFTGMDCEGGINIVGFDWDFGYPNNGGGSGISVSHVFPENGTYTVTVATTFKFLATGEECTVTRTFDVVITDCEDCGDCFFSEILLLGQDECKAEFFADFTGQKCEGGINIVGFEWDFGYPNNGGATGIQVGHVFPGNGTYTVTVATTFKFLATGEECTVTRTFDVVITDCEDCGECFFSEILLLGQKNCKAEFFADYTGQKCEGGINIVGFEWDFGYPNNGGASGIQVTHEFPANGTYTVTVETTFKFLATGEECTVTRTFDIVVTDCPGFTDGGNAGDRSFTQNTPNIFNEFAAKVLPNPFQNLISINYELAKDELVNISIIDVNGRVVYNNDTQGQSGQNNVQMDLADLASGMYFYKVSTATGSTTGKIVKE